MYRVQSVFGDQRVPAEYSGVWEEDLGALELAQERLGRPAGGDPGDAHSVPHAANGSAKHLGARRGRLDGRLAVARAPSQLHQRVAAAPACVDGWAHEQVTPLIPAVVWGQCDFSGNVVASYDKVKQFVAELWSPMTTLMGDPIGDAAPFGQAAARPEEGNGMIDFYVTLKSTQLGTRQIDPAVKAVAFARAVPEYRGSPGSQKASGYLVINPLANTPVGLKSTVAHEFFHVLASAHNAFGWRLPSGGHHWFTEASATWSEHFFAPTSQAEPLRCIPGSRASRAGRSHSRRTTAAIPTTRSSAAVHAAGDRQ